MKTKEEPYTYFQPGEILFFITHESNQPIFRRAKDPETKRLVFLESNSSEDNLQFEFDKKEDEEEEKLYDNIIDELLDWSKKIMLKHKPNLVISRIKHKEIHFPGTLNLTPAGHGKQVSLNDKFTEPVPHGAFSLIAVKLNEADEDEDDIKKPGRYINNSDLIKLMMELDDQRKDLPLKDITLQAVTLNWLCSAESEWGGGGGPGSIPEPYKGDPATEHRFALTRTSRFQGIVNQNGSEGEGVTVAILDTAPCLQDLAKAYERYHKVDPQNQKRSHAVIERLLGPGGPLVVHPASIDELYRMRAVHLRDHDYEMTDHGLFVAGIINTIAPKAKIHLYEVLNHQGVGDLQSIAHGFWKIFNSYSGEPLIVNSSLVLRIPRPNQLINDLDRPLLARIIKDENKYEEEEKKNKRLTLDLLNASAEQWLKRQGEVIEWICDHLFFRGSLVIAAAGNDWRSPDEARPSPGYPAAFKRVLGVGALPKDTQPGANNRFTVSSYSNLSDEPNEAGVAALGGEPGEGKGILGVYIGEFPDMAYRLNKLKWYLRPVMWIIYTLKWGNCIRPKNESDWAWWCGTSFATPIIAGFAAATLSSLGQGTTTRDAIGEMYATQGILPLQTPDNEDGFIGVTQN